MLTVIVTGAAGFIGMHLCQRLLDRGQAVIGVDDFNPYYEVSLKEARAARLLAQPSFELVRMDVAEAEAFQALTARVRPDLIVHLAAQAGVRYSIENPFAYERANMAGHLSVLEACRQVAVPQLVYASSSSVYGERPLNAGGFTEADPTDHPASLYAATKRGCELMSAAYGSLYGLAQTGLRFFTVYGPWGRPDMAYFSFSRKIMAGETIDVFGEGQMARDFTYIDDIIEGLIGVIDHPATAGEHRLFNIGDSRPVGLMRMIEVLELALGRIAIKRMLPMQPGDVSATFADVTKLKALCDYEPKIALEEGLPKFVHWFQTFAR